MSESQEITLTGGYWGPKYSKHNPNGFRIEIGDRDDLSKRLKSQSSWMEVTIEFPPNKSPRSSVEALRFSLPLTSSFWSTCPEFKSCEIGKWMKKRKDAPWPYRKPPKYIAELSTADDGAVKIKVLRKKKT